MRRHFFFFLAAWAIAATDANQTSATPNQSTDPVSSAHVPSQAATHANLAAATHANLAAATHANPTSATHVKTDQLVPTEASSEAPTHANPTSAPRRSTDHLTRANVLPLLIVSLSKPTIYYNPLSNTTHITCFSKSGLLPIRYQFYLNDRIEQEKTVHKPEPANFTIPMTPGTQVLLKCTAISAAGEQSSSDVLPVAIKPDDSPADDAETDPGRDGPDHLIPLQYILTSVTPAALEANKLVLIICGPVLLAIFVLFIVITYLRCQKEQKKAELDDERLDLLSF